MKNKALTPDMVRILAVMFLVVCSGWGPLLVAETVDRSTVASASPFQDLQYDSETQVLAVTFPNGVTYQYQQVPLAVFCCHQRVRRSSRALFFSRRMMASSMASRLK